MFMGFGQFVCLSVSSITEINNHVSVGSRNGLASNMRQVATQTNVDIVSWRNLASLSLTALIRTSRKNIQFYVNQI